MPKKVSNLQILLDHLNKGLAASSYPEKESEIYQALIKELRLLSAKEVIYGANVDENGISEDNDYVKALKEYAKKMIMKLSSFVQKSKKN